jgi:uncharacterized damage-inducible protein DinB
MNYIEMIVNELKHEAATTRKMLALVPFEKSDWKPHAKSMSIQQLTTHLAEIPGWIPMIVNTTELDFNAGNYQPTEINSTKQLLEVFEKNYQEATTALEKTSEARLTETWTMRGGDKIYSTDLKHEAIRHAYSQMVHHRAQLGVYLRLLEIPIPASYGASADDKGMFE